MDILCARFVPPNPEATWPPTNLYAVDGLCHNAEAGTYGHECSKPATWLGRSGPDRYWFGYCDDCKAHGTEARRCTEWRPHPKAAT